MSDITERLRDLVYLEQDADAVMEAADEIDRLRADLAGKEKALLAAKTVIDAKDRAYSVIDQRFAALSGKAATVDSERECNERLTAEIDNLRAALSAREAEVAEAVRRIGAARDSLDDCDAVSAHAILCAFLAAHEARKGETK